MLKRIGLFALAFCSIAQPSYVRAQQPEGKQVKTSAKKQPAKAAPTEVDPMMEVRRTTAISLINTLADDARMFRDPVLRARVQARAADALWETDKEKARTLFRRAWDEAEAADAESDRRVAEDRERQVRERGYASIQLPPSLRTEVLRLAAKRDQTLGEEFLTKMDEARKREIENAATSNERTDASQPDSSRRPDPTEATPAAAKRLRLAVQLLEDGDTERAILFADPALGSPNYSSLEFLARLRVKNAKAADERYAAMVARVAADPSSDANTVSLLSSYLFTPSLYVTFTFDAGSNGNSWGRLAAPTDIAPQLRSAFFRVAASILLRPTPTPDQDRTSAGRAGWYMVIARLLPLFDQFAPDRSAALHAKMASLASDTPERSRRPDNNALTTGLVPEDPNRDRVAETLRRLDEAKTSDERDAVYVDAVFDAIRQKDARVEEFLNKIEDIDVRKQVRAYVDFEAARAAISDKDVTAALKVARAGSLTVIQKTWTLTEVARLLAKSEPGRAVEVLDEAITEAKERIDAASKERASAFVAIATQLIELDRPRAWELMLEVVKASNAAKEFTGEDGRLNARLQTKNGVWSTSGSAQTFDLSGLFVVLAREDMLRAVDLARNFDGESPRAFATLAIARSALEKK
jgi:vacuolar-type H+-ATPase subunit F/Vma7